MKKKILALCLIIALAATAVIGGTLAYFTDTDDATNTFTVGKVDLDLIEDTKDGDGWTGGEKTDDGIKYDQVLPGINYSKDAYLTLKEGSVPSYVYIELSFNHASALWNALPDPDNDMLNELLINYNTEIFDLNETNLVERSYDVDNDVYTEVYFCGVKNAGDSIHLFEGVHLPAELDQDDLKELQAAGAFNFSLKGYAIQEAGIEGDYFAAWNALKAQNPAA